MALGYLFRVRNVRVDLDSLPGLLVPSAAARLFRLSPRRIQQLAAAGRFPGARKHFGRWIIPKVSLIHFLNSPRSKGGRGKRVLPAPDSAEFRGRE